MSGSIKDMSVGAVVWRQAIERPFAVRATVNRVKNELVGSYEGWREARDAADQYGDARIFHAVSGQDVTDGYKQDKVLGNKTPKTEHFEKLFAQYDAPPTEGLKRYWVGIETWAEEAEYDQFFFWTSSSGNDYRLRASVIGTPEAEGLPMVPVLSFAVDESLYTNNMSLVMLVDATDEAAAWQLIRSTFPDLKERFIIDAPNITLSSLNSNGTGRFQYPNPPASRGDAEPAGDSEEPFRP